MFFRDGKRRIDYVLVYSALDTNETARAKRYAFLTALAEQMIEIEVISFLFSLFIFIVTFPIIISYILCSRFCRYCCAFMR